MSVALLGYMHNLIHRVIESWHLVVTVAAPSFRPIALKKTCLTQSEEVFVSVSYDDQASLRTHRWPGVGRAVRMAGTGPKMLASSAAFSQHAFSEPVRSRSPICLLPLGPTCAERLLRAYDKQSLWAKASAGGNPPY